MKQQVIDNLNDHEIIGAIKKLERNRLISRIIIALIFCILLLTLIVCFRLGNIGFNAFTSWEVDEFELKGENVQIINDTKLNIFKGLKKDGKSLSPGASGSYMFSVNNKSNYDMIYTLKFEEAMASINMKYRLKLDNIYVKGSGSEYIGIEDLNLENVIVPKNSTNIYTLEWKWVDDDENDASTGNGVSNYYFKLQIFSNIYKR